MKIPHMLFTRLTGIKKLALALGLVLLPVFLFGQLGVGQWRTHLSYAFLEKVTTSSTHVYAASDKAIFKYHKSNGSIELYTTIDRLSDVGISALLYDEQRRMLVVGYANGNLDLIVENQTLNISDFKRKALLGDKRIYEILVLDDELYLATGIGILLVDLQKKEIRETYVLGAQGSYLRVNDLAYRNGFLYAATDQGLFKGARGTTLLIYEEGWEKISLLGHYDKRIKQLAAFGEGWLIVTEQSPGDDLLYQLSEEGGESLISSQGPIAHVHAWDEGYAVAFSQALVTYSNQHTVQQRYEGWGSFSARPRCVSGHSEEDLWVADHGAGLVQLQNPNQSIIPNGPYGSEVYQVQTAGEYTYTVPGALDETWTNSYTSTKLYSFHKNQWHTDFDYSTYDAIDLAVDTRNPRRVALATWGSGLLIFENDEFIRYDTENSSLTPSAIGDQCRVGGCCYDDKGNLWITQANAPSPLHVFSRDGVWQDFDFDGLLSNTLISKVLIDDQGVKWLLLPRGGGLWVYDDNQTPLNTKDDRYKQVPIVDQNGAFITNDVYSIAKDLEGKVWAGTVNGVVIFSNPEAVFDEDLFVASRPVITIDGVTERLLNGNRVTAIAVDGANRKWFGTRNSGTFLTSETGEKLVEQFSTENSPLFSNHILSIRVNDISGEVFFATREGLLSYGGSATLGGDDFGNVYVYPNPVREEYTGDIVVRGLLRDALVKITDISGNIVYETRADGGQATWNGKNFDGRRVSTGVYLVFCTNSDGSKTHITKLLFIR
ncbi:MAG: T9SS type A sorting domain-containing protein [Bacteroidales bacterium]